MKLGELKNANEREVYSNRMAQQVAFCVGLRLHICDLHHAFVGNNIFQRMIEVQPIVV